MSDTTTRRWQLEFLPEAAAEHYWLNSPEVPGRSLSIGFDSLLDCEAWHKYLNALEDCATALDEDKGDISPRHPAMEALERLLKLRGETP